MPRGHGHRRGRGRPGQLLPAAQRGRRLRDCRCGAGARGARLPARAGVHGRRQRAQGGPPRARGAAGVVPGRDQGPRRARRPRAARAVAVVSGGHGARRRPRALGHVEGAADRGARQGAVGGRRSRRAPRAARRVRRDPAPAVVRRGPARERRPAPQALLHDAAAPPRHGRALPVSRAAARAAGKGHRQGAQRQRGGASAAPGGRAAAPPGGGAAAHDAAPEQRHHLVEAAHPVGEQQPPDGALLRLLSARRRQLRPPAACASRGAVPARRRGAAAPARPAAADDAALPAADAARDAPRGVEPPQAGLPGRARPRRAARGRPRGGARRRRDAGQRAPRRGGARGGRHRRARPGPRGAQAKPRRRRAQGQGLEEGAGRAALRGGARLQRLGARLPARQQGVAPLLRERPRGLLALQGHVRGGAAAEWRRERALPGAQPRLRAAHARQPGARGGHLRDQGRAAACGRGRPVLGRARGRAARGAARGAAAHLLVSGLEALRRPPDGARRRPAGGLQGRGRRVDAALRRVRPRPLAVGPARRCGGEAARRQPAAARALDARLLGPGAARHVRVPGHVAVCARRPDRHRARGPHGGFGAQAADARSSRRGRRALEEVDRRGAQRARAAGGQPLGEQPAAHLVSARDHPHLSHRHPRPARRAARAAGLVCARARAAARGPDGRTRPRRRADRGGAAEEAGRGGGRRRAAVRQGFSAGQLPLARRARDGQDDGRRRRRGARAAAALHGAARPGGAPGRRGGRRPRLGEEQARDPVAAGAEHGARGHAHQPGAVRPQRGGARGAGAAARRAAQQL